MNDLVKAFNGFVFNFSNAPTIIGMTIDSGSTFTPTDFSFTADSISINLSGNSVTTTSTLILDIQSQAAAAPEPATFSLMLLGFGLLAFVVMKQKGLSLGCSQAI
jgi:hypothetical protein